MKVQSYSEKKELRDEGSSLTLPSFPIDLPNVAMFSDRKDHMKQLLTKLSQPLPTKSHKIQLLAESLMEIAEL